MFGSLGMPELIVIFVIALIVFGPRKLPELGRSLGRGINEFKKATSALQSTLEDEVRAEEQRDQAAKVATTGGGACGHRAHRRSRAEGRFGPLTTHPMPAGRQTIALPTAGHGSHSPSASRSTVYVRVRRCRSTFAVIVARHRSARSRESLRLSRSAAGHLSHASPQPQPRAPSPQW